MDSRKFRKSVLPLVVLIGAVALLALPWKRWFGTSQPAPVNRPISRIDRARRLLAANRFDDVIRLGSQIAPDSVDVPEIYAIVGQAFLGKGDVGNARKAFEESLNRKLEQPEALEILAAIYLASGDAVRGLALLELVAKLKPDEFRPWLAMGKVRQDMGELEEAVKAYSESLKRAPPSQEAKTARMGLIRAMIDQNRSTEASPVVTEALRNDPDDPDFLGMAALIAQSEGKPNEAVEMAKKCLDADPKNADALLALAQVRFLEGKADEAEPLLEKANQARPNQTSVLQLLMQAQARQGKTREAAATKEKFRTVTERISRMDKLSKRISTEPENPAPRYELGMEALEADMDTLAEQCFRAALDLDPNYEPARKALESMTSRAPGAEVPPGPGKAP
jgi:cytochrome c-type biogenesis protein CcmH/NrfG